MKTFWLGGVAALAIMASLAGQAHAADLPAAAPAYKTPAVVPSPAFNWAGFYVGANGGYGTSRNCWAVVAPPPAGSEGCHNATGGLPVARSVIAGNRAPGCLAWRHRVTGQV